MKVSIGSLNPAKIRAVELAVKKIFNEEVEIIPIEVKDAPKQPMSDEEMIEGAIHRAEFAYNKTRSDYSVGLEGGLIKNEFGVFVKGWVAIYDGKNIGLASTVSVPLPNYVWDFISKGLFDELEKIMVRLSGIENIATSIGAIGYIANNHYDRIRAFRDAVICAFGRFLRKEIFEAKPEL